MPCYDWRWHRAKQNSLLPGWEDYPFQSIDRRRTEDGKNDWVSDNFMRKSCHVEINAKKKSFGERKINMIYCLRLHILTLIDFRMVRLTLDVTTS